ncbi:hypothetical protein GXW71_28285 [Roseomonas hellenica]|uniref:DUF4254 domain-containing protein n=1 Tax=Plastoroseomonas hellenica TaxID=2687306 RepID=A0ABS5F6V6_9PROT|nr:hypothetical protein [Plastoroseomonas hellenica]MBR0668284.1 hypothetical protein [Plastoroseomonas hellenica]
MSDDANSQRLLARIASSTDRPWLTTCRDHNRKPGRVIAAATAAEERLRDLDLQMALSIRPAGATLEDRVFEALRVYREILKHKHGRNQAAGHTERAIRNHGPRGALLVALKGNKPTDGLLRLAEFDRLDCSYEQIAIDFAHELPPDVVERARRNLAMLSAP